MDDDQLPLAGLRVVEFSHMVMGPAIGMILADLGADVTRIEPIGGDRTRRLLGSGAGYFPMYNRNKRSVCLDLKDPRGVAVAKALALGADVVIENFRPGALDCLGLGQAALARDNERLIYCSAKGFLTGPYEERTALDEVAQMMGGLAYMTGPPGRPLRAGASVIDVTGGLFGVIGILAVLERRNRTGKGGGVKCSLFETTAFLVGQHMAQQAVTGKAAAPMPVRISAWAIYDVFETVRPDEQIFVGVVSDGQWSSFCTLFRLDDLAADPALALNNDRVLARDRLLPRVREVLGAERRDELVAKLGAIGLPVAPIARPEDLFDDPQLARNGLVEVTLPSGTMARLPAIPLELDGARFGLRHDLASPGENSRETLRALGYDDPAIDELVGAGVVE